MSHIEVLGPDHSTEIYHLIRDYQQRSQQGIAQLNWNLCSIAEILKSEKAIGFIQYNEKTSYGKVLAFVIYRDLIDIAEILILGTKLEQQSQGLMRSLLSSLKENYSGIWLEVHELNTRAFQFYEKESFKLDGVRPKYYTDSKSALIMSWKRDLAIC